MKSSPTALSSTVRGNAPGARTPLSIACVVACLLSIPLSSQAASRLDDTPATSGALPAESPPTAPGPIGVVPSRPVAGQRFPASPSVLYAELFRDVQLGGIFADSKTFPDMIPDRPPAEVLAAYRREKHTPGFDLRSFVSRHFSLPARRAREYRSDPRQGIGQHIQTLWKILLRQPQPVSSPDSSLLPLDFPYVVPGGRFDEIYYWDSYFIMLGLENSGHHDLAVDELNNFASLIRRYGHVPNGNRSYYLSRSQPPFFSLMVELVAARDGDAVLRRYRPELEREYAYWMDGADTLKPGGAWRHVLRTRDGALLNRYWDDFDTPRDESYREDVATASASARPAAEVYRDLRAGAESGWDFSSRWLARPDDLATIRVTSLAPVDLNSLMFNLERVLAKAYRASGDRTRAEAFDRRAAARRAALDRLMWDPERQAYLDYDFADDRRSACLSAATAYPLFFGMASAAQGAAVAATLRERLLDPGGLATTARVTGQQWDAPNGWAPLQYLAVVGLRRYGEDKLAATLARRWIAKNLAVFRQSGKLVEKYDVRMAKAAGGGEYPLQDGFGWTNGVLLTLLASYPLPEVVRHDQRAAAASAPRPAAGLAPSATARRSD